ncbi:MAG: NAD(P)/FAD-dependent oxidoreductase [Pseudomonadota bacterium]
MIRKITRRRFGGWVGAGAVATQSLAGVRVARAAKPRVVVVGGGAGGATAARYVASAGDIDVTLIEANKSYTTCFFSNLYLGGFRSLQSITHRYDRLSEKFGIGVINAIASAVDVDKKEVVLADGDRIGYDKLILAPGIDFKYDAIEGYGPEAETRMPHAYKAGMQTKLLRDQVMAMEDGGVVCIAPPPNPFRCPPGPYERASMIAHYLKQHKPKSKLVIVDAKNEFSKQALFEEGWARFYPDIIEWLPEELTGGIGAVDPKAMAVITEAESIKASVINVIPPQHAGAIARSAGAADASGWCPVHAATLASKRLPDIHLVGDAIIPGDMPKSGFSANSQAKVCANAIAAELLSKQAIRPSFLNTCWSLVATDHGIKVGAAYEATDEKIKKTSGFISKVNEADDVRAMTANEANAWYAGITQDIFA